MKGANSREREKNTRERAKECEKVAKTKRQKMIINWYQIIS